MENRYLELNTDVRSMRPWGLSVFVDLFGCNSLKVRDAECLKDFSRLLCEAIDMIPYKDPMVERFAEGTLEGNSMLQFIQTSSITVHCDEEYDRVFVDVFSCKMFDPKIAEEFCKEFFNAEESIMEPRKRG